MSVSFQPLADKIRPVKLDEIVGQDHLLGKNGEISKFLDQKTIPSFILWGPPGTGKTTLGKTIARQLNFEIFFLSAVFSGVGDLKKIFHEAKQNLLQEKRTILFIDEIHRFNKLQQDSLLAATESGFITLIGATTENPSFSINNALLSRTQVFLVHPLDPDSLAVLLRRAENSLGKKIKLTPQAKEKLYRLADGDGRKLINLVEKIHLLKQNQQPIDEHGLKAMVQTHLRYDKGGDEHYNLISALHKSLRGSDCEASLYWLSRMLLSGEDPHYIFRRLLRFSYEDIGLADPQAALYTMNGWQTYERLGSPEGDISLAQSVIYLALAPKSNQVYRSLDLALEMAKTHGSLSPPKHILNAPTRLMKEIGYGKGYRYDHDQEHSFSGQNYFPESIKERPQFYQPLNRGFEREMIKRLAYFNQLRKKANPKS